MAEFRLGDSVILPGDLEGKIVAVIHRADGVAYNVSLYDRDNGGHKYCEFYAFELQVAPNRPIGFNGKEQQR